MFERKMTRFLENTLPRIKETLEKFSEARLREWAINDYFSKTELKAVEDLKDETIEDQNEIIRKAQAGNKSAIMYLIIKNNKLLGSFFIKKIMPYHKDKDTAFDEFMSTIAELMFDTSEDSVLNKYKEGENLRDPIGYFGNFLILRLQNVYFNNLKKEKRKGVVGNLKLDTEENLGSAASLDSIEDIRYYDKEYTGDTEKKWKKIANLFNLDKQWETLKEVIAETFADTSGEIDLAKNAEKLDMGFSRYKRYLEQFGKLLEKYDISFEDFHSFVLEKGYGYIAKSLGVEKVKEREVKIDKKPYKYEGVKKNATEWTLEFLKTNPKGSKGTYKDFLKSDVYAAAQGIVTMKNFNSAKDRLKKAGKLEGF